MPTYVAFDFLKFTGICCSSLGCQQFALHPTMPGMEPGSVNALRDAFLRLVSLIFQGLAARLCVC